jgi:hypothetical protein
MREPQRSPRLRLGAANVPTAAEYALGLYDDDELEAELQIRHG